MSTTKSLTEARAELLRGLGLIGRSAQELASQFGTNVQTIGVRMRPLIELGFATKERVYTSLYYSQTAAGRAALARYDEQGGKE